MMLQIKNKKKKILGHFRLCWEDVWGALWSKIKAKKYYILSLNPLLWNKMNYHMLHQHKIFNLFQYSIFQKNYDF
jgi:hypothetical protein